MTKQFIHFFDNYVGYLLCYILTAIRFLLNPFSNKSKSRKISGKIVFVKFIEQGAFVLHYNTFKTAIEKYGIENIFICTFSSNQQLLTVLNIVSPQNVIYIDEKNIFNFTATFFTALIKIRNFGIDTAIDLEFYANATAIFCYLSGAAKRAGYHRYLGSQNYRGDLFTHRLSYSHYVHVADSSFCLLKSIDLPIENLPALDIELPKKFDTNTFIPDKNDLTRISRLLGPRVDDGSPLIVINPSLNDALPLRKWPSRYYHEFIATFRSRYPEFKFVFTGRSDEQELTNQFIAATGLPDAINLCGKTELRDILTLYTRAKLLLTSDSGPGHFATLTSISAIVLFGPETPVLYAPLSERTQVLYSNLPCSPCFNVYNNRQSPCKNNVCMQKISVGEVINAADKVLQNI